MLCDEMPCLLISGDLRTLIEKRGIREEDIRSVLCFAESESQFHTQVSTGHRVAYFTPSKVTYWVEYGLEECCYAIYNAYSHRMKILHGCNMPSKKMQTETDWFCTACNLPLELATVKLANLDETFSVDLLACPACQRVMVSEEQAVVKMALAEQMLEGK